MSLHLTYIGCEGVLVRSAGASVLIDGLFGPAARPYGVPPAAALESLRHARPPFDGADVVLATHFHGDHFDAGAVADYLRASPATRFVSTPQAVDRLVGETGDAFADRVTTIEPVEGARSGVTAGRVRVEGFGLSHGKVTFAGVQHLGLIVDLDGRTIVHLGDGIIDERSMRSAGLLDEVPDVGVLPFWFLTYPFGRRLVEDRFRPRSIFAVHVPVSERERLVPEIASWIDATPLIEPLSRYGIDAAGNVSREE